MMAREDAAGASGGGSVGARDGDASAIVHLTTLQHFLLPLRLFRFVQSEVVLYFEDLPTHAGRHVHLQIIQITVFIIR